MSSASMSTNLPTFWQGESLLQAENGAAEQISLDRAVDFKCSMSRYFIVSVGSGMQFLRAMRLSLCSCAAIRFFRLYFSQQVFRFNGNRAFMHVFLLRIRPLRGGKCRVFTYFRCEFLHTGAARADGAQDRQQDDRADQGDDCRADPSARHDAERGRDETADDRAENADYQVTQDTARPFTRHNDLRERTGDNANDNPE